MVIVNRCKNRLEASLYLNVAIHENIKITMLHRSGVQKQHFHNFRSQKLSQADLCVIVASRGAPKEFKNQSSISQQHIMQWFRAPTSLDDLIWQPTLVPDRVQESMVKPKTLFSEHSFASSLNSRKGVGGIASAPWIYIYIYIFIHVERY